MGLGLFISVLVLMMIGFFAGRLFAKEESGPSLNFNLRLELDEDDSATRQPRTVNRKLRGRRAVN